MSNVKAHSLVIDDRPAYCAISGGLGGVHKDDADPVNAVNEPLGLTAPA